MIYIKNKDFQEVHIPKHTHDDINRFYFTLKSESTEKEYSYEVYDKGYLTDFYIFELRVDIVPDGEYNFEVKYHGDGTDSLRTRGLMRVGKYENNKQNYNNNKKYQYYEG